jgi:large subunit ribosomal protein L22
MGQSANAKRTKENEARAIATYVRSGERRLNLVAQMIRGKDASRALTDLEFSTRRVSQDVRKCLQAAISNAENNHGLDVDRLYVSEATVGKTIRMRRYHARGRGRSAPVEKSFSRLTITVREKAE